jgi:hypothetical protein
MGRDGRIVSVGRPFKKKPLYEDSAGCRHQITETEFMNICPHCADICVQLTGVEVVGRVSFCWHVHLKCPNCALCFTRYCNDDSLQAFEANRDKTQFALAQQLRRETVGNMEAEVDALCSALDMDLIGPDDFHQAVR